MEMIAPDILADVKQLSTGLLATGLVIGSMLWLVGWWSHRFWVVLGFTVLGGIWGLQNAGALRSQPLVAAIGVGMTAGILALTVIRLGAFVAGGYAGLIVAHAAFPTWDQPLLSFLIGGLSGYLLFRYWTMALTSLAGVVLMGHTILGIADRLGKLDAVAWSEGHAKLLTTVCGFAALSGFLIQVIVDWLRRPGAAKSEKKDVKKGKSEIAGFLNPFRRAG